MVKKPLIERNVIRHPFAGDKFTFPFILAETRDPFHFSGIENVSKHGIGLNMSAFVDPETTVIAVVDGKEVEFRVVHSTYVPDKDFFLCGMQIKKHQPFESVFELLEKSGDHSKVKFNLNY